MNIAGIFDGLVDESMSVAEEKKDLRESEIWKKLVLMWEVAAQQNRSLIGWAEDGA